MNKISFVVGLLALTACGPELSAPGSTQAQSQAVSGSTQSGGGGTKTCWDGVAPRPAADPIGLPSLTAQFDAWHAAMAQYELDAAAFSVESAAHAAAFNAAASGVVGRFCSIATPSDCFIDSSIVSGFCRGYYQHGQCGAIDLNPLPPGPVPPPQPSPTCADFTCADPNFQCALETSTGGIACVLQRCVGGGNGGGGSGGGGKGGGKP
jgi:hypothetical protein